MSIFRGVNQHNAADHLEAANQNHETARVKWETVSWDTANTVEATLVNVHRVLWNQTHVDLGALMGNVANDNEAVRKAA